MAPVRTGVQAVEKIAIVSKPRMAIISVNDHNIIWLQYSLQKLLATEVVFLSWEQAAEMRLEDFSWIICDCSAALGERGHVEAFLAKITWQKGKTIVRFNSTRTFQGQIEGVEVFQAHAKAHEYAEFIQTGVRA